MRDREELTTQLLSVAAGLAGDSGFDMTLTRLCELAVGELPGADFAGITMLRHGRPTTTAFTDPTSPEIDAAQYESGAGPCLEAFHDGIPYAIEDTAEDDRWPEFSAAAEAHGIRSTLSMPLEVEGNSLGALNLYSAIAGSFSDEDRDAAELFAIQAAAVLANAQAYWTAHALSTQLQEALNSRAVIDQAIGMLMARHDCSPQEGLEMLRGRSQMQNRKVRDLAREIVERAAPA